MREKAIKTYEITRTYIGTQTNDFLSLVSQNVFDIENRGNRAEVHYAITASGSSFIQSAIIIEREEL